MVLKRMELIRFSMLAMSCIVLCACQSGSSPQSDSQDPPLTMIDYTGVWSTACLPLNEKMSNTVRLELDNGNYRSELYVYSGQDCNSIEHRDYSEIEIGTYSIGDTVEVPSGVVAHGVNLFVESRVRDGVPDVISGDQVEGDFFHRDGNKLYRATGQRIGYAGIFVPEEVNFSVVYYLQE